MNQGPETEIQHREFLEKHCVLGRNYHLQDIQLSKSTNVRPPPPFRASARLHQPSPPIKSVTRLPVRLRRARSLAPDFGETPLAFAR